MTFVVFFARLDLHQAADVFFGKDVIANDENLVDTVADPFIDFIMQFDFRLVCRKLLMWSNLNVKITKAIVVIAQPFHVIIDGGGIVLPAKQPQNLGFGPSLGFEQWTTERFIAVELDGCDLHLGAFINQKDDFAIWI